MVIQNLLLNRSKLNHQKEKINILIKCHQDKRRIKIVNKDYKVDYLP